MRHLKSGSKLGRNPSHRRATLRSLVTNLFEHGAITTTLTRAKAARPVAEKIITLGKRDTLQSRRQAASYIMLPAITQKLFSEIAPKFSDRAGGCRRREVGATPLHRAEHDFLKTIDEPPFIAFGQLGAAIREVDLPVGVFAQLGRGVGMGTLHTQKVAGRQQ